MANHSIRELSNVKRFFTNPETYSARTEYAEYQPLLSSAFALDYSIAGRVEPLLFQLENFIWFTIQLFLFYLIVRLLPGGSHNMALFAAALYGVHPLAAETVNYALQRGMIYSSLGVLAGLLVWIVWPRHLPADFLISVAKVPKNDWDMFLINQRPRISATYRFIRNSPFPLYMVPVVMAMLAGPAGLIFPALLLAYICLFEGGEQKRRVLPAAVVCGVIWMAQCIIVWKHAGFGLVPVLSYWSTEPWVVIRYFFAFFISSGVKGLDGLLPFDHLWSPLALAGYGGLAALVWVAYKVRQKPEWKVIAFGLWWFLAGLVPFVLMPQRSVEAYSREFFAYAGLVLVVSGAASLLLKRLEALPWNLMVPLLGAPALAALVLISLGAVAYDRNKAWVSDEALWGEAVSHDPSDGHAVLHYGLTFMANGAADLFGVRYSLGYDYLQRAAKLLPNNAQLDTELAIACQQVGREADAEGYFRKALAAPMPPAKAYAGYSAWLLTHQKTEEAFQTAAKAVALDSSDVIGRRTLAEINIARYQWRPVLRLADESLALNPDDPDAQRARNVALAGIEAARYAAQLVREAPSVDRYLKLSTIYFEEGKFDEVIEACRRALKLQPDLAEAHANMAAAYHSLGKKKEAVAALREAFRLRPDLEVVKNNLQYELAQNEGVSP